MAPRSSYAKATLRFPIFAAEFDPYNRGYLVVGGGGGEGRSGVPNQIAVLDISNRANITTAIEVDLSRDEDSVQSLASLATKDGLITFAGINSSQAEQNAGKNEHFRSFEIKYPPRKKQKTEDAVTEPKPRASLIGKRAAFKQEPAAKSERYQRLLRLSPVHRQSAEGSRRIGAIASGLAKQAEVVVFNATTPTPETADVIARIEPEDDAEVVDLDIANTGNNEFSLTYCTDHDIFEQSYQYDFATKTAQKTPKGPRRIHSMPDGEGAGLKHKFRCLRFLDSQNVIALVNKADKKGTELRVFHLYPTGPASMILQMQLPSHVKQAVSMDVCALDADSKGDRQIAVAVAGQDISIETWTLNYTRSTDTFSRFQSYQSVRDVHAHQMTKICFSPFHSPVRTPAPSPTADGQTTAPQTETVQNPGPQHLKLASVSYGNTVVVDAFPLSPLNPKDRNSRYILQDHAAKTRRQYLNYAFAAFIVLMIGVLFQAYLTLAPSASTSSLSGLLPPGARPIVEKPIHAAHDAASAISSSIPTNIPGVQRLADLLSHSTHSSKALIVRDSPMGTDLSVDAHVDKEALLKEHVEAKHWDELHEHQQAEWKRRLIDAGRWAESEGESVLKGVMWSSYAGFVGGVAGEVLREL
ncbi:hypothetical protein B0A48_09622 [Cryoendolithus antarcticus]|uniref:Guanine nucleotide-exchange factor SEC12 n=1 Tax=Cryoendolithus antarcticus TaxID=1507870 RepID=A0A1V8T057_9PEZI|nr:hypothetical protein B0A48_09622 [Cryoendolithus antarcticus]